MASIDNEEDKKSGSKRRVPEIAPESAPAARAETSAAEAPRAQSFPIVGLGASAGGLAVLEAFFSAMPSDAGIAFVVVTHLDPTQPSLLAELLARKTQMPVMQLSKVTAAEPNHVYTTQPGFDLAIINGFLQPVEAVRRAPPHLPIDSFFRSLAQDQRDHAIAIVLSGTGSDGSQGIKEIKGELGMVMVQQEQSAEYDGMPRSAIATGMADYVLPVSAMPKQLLAYLKAHSLKRHLITSEPPLDELQQVFLLIRDRTGHDFSHYKPSTIGRRIERRMSLHHLASVQEYARHLQGNPLEVELLFKELLIGVTSFFRDAEAWEALSTCTSKLLADTPVGSVLRVWIAGCSTGEEAYSMAILLREQMDALGRTLTVQIFATDLDPVAVDVARNGVYPANIASDVSAQRLTRFFTQEDEVYRVKKEIRELVVFAPHNLIADPPFTKLDLLCCRNLLIYLDSALQRRLMPNFHYSLKPQGLLFLGSSESLGSCIDLFSVADKKWKIFRRSGLAAGSFVAEFPRAGPPAGGGVPLSPSARGGKATDLTQLIDRTLLKELVPPTVVIHERGDVVHVHGRTGLFLEPAQGSQASANIFNMARTGLQGTLAATVRQAAATDEEIVHGVHIKINGNVVSVELRVKRLQEPESLCGLFRVSFVAAAPASLDAPSVGADAALVSPTRIDELERELRFAKKNHEGATEELQISNEELKSANEELQSTNEELQSTNEELGTSKEEMQSLNEELQTVNAEIQGKVEELSRANNDMKNLLNGTNIATIFLDNQLNIKRYTEQAKNVIRLIATDVGRPVGDLVSMLRYDNLVQDAGQVLRTLEFKQIEIATANGESSYLMRMSPYRTTDNVIDGVVLTFVDVTTIKTLQREQERLLWALNNAPVSSFGQDQELRFTWVYGVVFGKLSAALLGRSDAEVLGLAAAEQIIELKRQVLASGRPEKRRLNIAVAGVQRTYQLYIEPTLDSAGQVTGLSGVAMDITPAHESTERQKGPDR